MMRGSYVPMTHKTVCMEGTSESTESSKESPHRNLMPIMNTTTSLRTIYSEEKKNSNDLSQWLETKWKSEIKMEDPLLYYTLPNSDVKDPNKLFESTSFDSVVTKSCSEDQVFPDIGALKKNLQNFEEYKPFKTIEMVLDQPDKTNVKEMRSGYEKDTSNCDKYEPLEKMETNNEQEKNNHPSISIKVKPPEDLGIPDLDIFSNYQQRQLKALQKRNHERSPVYQTCLIYVHYFTFEVIGQIKKLITLLSNVIDELQKDEILITVLKKYSKEYVETFNKIMNEFISLMNCKYAVPCIYVHIHNGLEKLNKNNIEYIRLLILQIFTLEKYKCEEDWFSQQSLDNYKLLLYIYTTNLKDIIVEDEVIDLMALKSIAYKDVQHLPTHKRNLMAANTSISEDLSDQQLASKNCHQPLKTDVLNSAHEPSMFYIEEELLKERLRQFQLDLAIIDAVKLEAKENYEEMVSNILHNPVCWNQNCNQSPQTICLCGQAAYCSKDCKEMDWWSTHFKECSFYKDTRRIFDISS